MRTLSANSTFLRTALMVAASLLGLPAAVVAQQSIGQVGWLQGCWEATLGRSIVEELWMAPRGSMMLMVGRTVREGTLIEYEVVVVRDEGGTLVYEAHPSGQAPASFRATTVTDDLVLFENPEHDFPKRIGYRRSGPDAVLAWVEGPSGGQNRRIEFNYRRAACPGTSR